MQDIEKLIEIVKTLRNPKDGCDWDLKQNHVSLIPYLLEETYELVDAIKKNDDRELKEELGDLLFQVVYLSQIASEKNKFDFNDVVDSISSKMILRHPHVFKGKKFKNMKEFTLWWEKSKNKKKNSILEGIPFTYPAYLEANKIQKKVASVGFEYENELDAIKKVYEETQELETEVKAKNKKKTREN